MMWMMLSLALMAQPGTQAVAGPIDPCESVVVAQTRASLDALRAARGVHVDLNHPVVTAVYEGTASLEAHLMRPGMVRALPVRLELVIDPTAHGYSLRETTGANAAARTQTTLAIEGRVAEQPSADAPFVESTAPASAVADLAHWLPSTAVAAAADAAPSCRPGLTVEQPGLMLSPVTFIDAAGRACTLLLDADHRVSRIESLSSHPRLGDVCNWTQFDEWEQHGGVTVPHRLSRFIVQEAATVRYDLSLVSFNVAAAATEGAFALPGERQGDIRTWGARRPPGDGMEFVSLAPAIWSVEIAAANTRVLVIERGKDLVVLGAPDGDAVCGELMTALKYRFAGKPVGLVAFGHHHPSPSGGLRACAATGATIVAPRRLEGYVRGLLSRSTSLGSPAVPGPEQPRLDLFDQEKTIDCGGTSVRLIDIGEHSAHAFSYVVFYFPDQRLVYEDDLGFFPVVGVARVSPRLKGLVEAIEAMRIEPERLVQAWPVRNAKRSVEWSSVVELVNAERTRLQAK
jgi:glyoxylase-like metal-dependent hydrolase (beta-lactamase superfamily II)